MGTTRVGGRGGRTPGIVLGVGLGGFAGSVGAFAFQWMTGQILEATGSNYSIIFVICGLGYVTALGIFHLIVPRLEPADMQR